MLLPGQSVDRQVELEPLEQMQEVEGVVVNERLGAEAAAAF